MQSTSEEGGSRQGRDAKPRKSLAPLRPFLRAVLASFGSPSRALILLFLGFHLALTLQVFPPSLLLQAAPLLPGDYPTHAHRMHLYREALRAGDLPWGCDPALNAGMVTNPTEDIGAKALQLLAAALPFIPVTHLLRWLAFLALATLPAGVLMACRVWRMPAAAMAGSLCALLFLFWTNPVQVLAYRWGLLTFAVASFLAPWMVALLTRYAQDPGRRTAGTTVVALALLFALHLLGPLMVAVPLLAWFVVPRLPPWRGKLMALLLGGAAIAVNLVWLVPFCIGYLRDPAFWGGATLPGLARDLTLSSIKDLRPPDRGVALAMLFRGLIPLLALPFFTRLVGRYAGHVFGLAAVANIFITLAGSFVPLLRDVQPVRFALTVTAFLSIPAGCFLAWLVTAEARRKAPCIALVLVLLLLRASTWGRLPRPGYDERVTLAPNASTPERLTWAWPEPVEQIVTAGALTDHIRAHTLPTERVLVQTRLKSDLEAYALWWHREVIGSAYAAVRDPMQFDRTYLLGRPCDSWDAVSLRRQLQRYGITRAVAWSSGAADQLAAAWGTGERVGEYTVFRAPEPPSRFLAGAGTCEASVNRLDLRDLQPGPDGRIVLAYRYHPAWHGDPPVTIAPYRVPDSDLDFMVLVNPPAKCVLRFNPLQVFAGRSGVRVAPVADPQDAGQ